jgi:hypothetical protein
MHRAVVLTTLVVLLLAVAGVSAAQESGIFLGGPSSDVPPGSTTPERTSFGATVAEDPETTSALPGPSSKLEDGEDTSDPTGVTESTVGETEEPAVVSPVEERALTPDSNKGGKPGSSGKDVGKPEDAGKPPNIGEPQPRDDVGHPGNGEPEERGNEAGHGRGLGQHKVILCHKGKTLTVGAPALEAHLAHHVDDSEGACQPGEAGSEPSGDTMGPEAAKNGGGASSRSRGQDKVPLCHKGKKTLTVGAPAWAAHKRHGDSLGACP